ncbi:general secretion pathway protein GspB [Gilvimarinus polysaccharolyticus]|uniref:general secretion pathway protein GspB n=1 Tax=Gilvimarinus polysaccharolyticus TaxID=863921 RepID=UPI0006734B05|nr:general secretion pathway protein GspB [Gilvimarinus polysaccharolyticus]
MSLILDALRKADHERQQQPHGVPGIDALHSPAEAPVQKLWPWISASVLLLLVLLMALIWLILERNDVEPVITNVTEPVQIRSAQSSAISAAAIARAPAAKENAAKAQVTVGTQASSSQASSALSVAERPELAPSASAKKPVVDDEVAQLYRTPPPDEPPETVAPRVQVTPAQITAAAQPNIATIRDLPLAVQNDIPTLIYTAHTFRRNDTSEVMINNQTLREGQKLGDLTLETITESGVIMRKGEHRFQLTALSSWVNM